MEASATHSRLASIADNTYFVLGAYFFAFFPWAVMHNIDFISEKWRTVRRTRTLSYAHIISSLVPCLYVAVYAEAQRQKKDSKELGAAMAALMFNLIQLLRTLMGKIQLEAFAAWCKHAVECLRALVGADDEKSKQGEDDGSGYEGSGANNTNTVDDKVRVNNTVIDNELGGTDVTVLPSWRKMWNGLTKGEFNPSKWLKADLAVLCTVRWCGAYLCGMGEDWSVTGSLWKVMDDFDQRSRLELFFSKKLYWSRYRLQHVTWNNNEENENFEVVSIKWLGNPMTRVDLSGETTTAFGSGITDFDVDGTWGVDSYSLEVDSLASSYPASGSDREGVTVGLVHSVILAKHLGVEKLKGIRRYYKQHQMPKGGILGKALKLFLKQTRDDNFDQSETFKMFCTGSSRLIPLFPYRMQLVSLWEQETNWRVLQASAHADIRNTLWYANTKFTPLHQVDTKPDNVFDYYSNSARNVFKEHQVPGCAGTVLESVRSFLAEWRMKTKQEADWEPVVPMEYLEFSTPRNILDGCGDANEDCVNTRLLRRMIWICQRALQREVSGIPSRDQNLPSNNALIMLLLFGFPILHMEKVDESDVRVYDSNSNVCEDDAPPSRPHHTLNLSTRTWKVTSELAAQDIWIEIRIDLDAQRCQVGLRKGHDVSRFVWQDWVDAAMAFMAGYNYRGGGKGEYERRIRRADLRDTIVELSPLRTDEDKRVIETSIVGVWMGWPPFDVHICKFEMEHWLNACDIDLATHRLVPDDSESGNEKILEDVDLELQRAEGVIESVVFGEAEEVRGEIK